MASTKLNKLELLKKLDLIQPEEAASRDDEQLRAMSLARSLRAVAELQSEHAYVLCREVAKRALGHVPEPEKAIQD